MIFQIFQTVRTCVKRGSGNICSVSVFFVRVGSQISPPLGEQDQLNALPQGQQRQSNPHPMPCPPPPPRRLNIDRCIMSKVNRTTHNYLSVWLYFLCRVHQQRCSTRRRWITLFRNIPYKIGCENSKEYNDSYRP